jgi:ubiquinone biosynthesis monooxygenase Coq7
MIDRFITHFDLALRTVAGVHRGVRETPAAGIAEGDLSDQEKALAARLMRVNHCGEVCAQALYQGQAMASDNPELAARLGKAAREEEDHLAWSADRIHELGGRTSLLNPLWYAGALAIGVVAGKLGERWNLGFLAETEHQVEQHLDGHLKRLSEADGRTRAVVDSMKQDEMRHAQMARDLGADELPAPVKGAMKLASRVMTGASFWI